ncbi:hypothetical protein AAVH_09500 [Aphelenchoides avenae]|nr:hypothetical protein AAVH_09500 [Aphelenchus avenae]
MGRLSDVCLRHLSSARFRAPNENANRDGRWVIQVDGRPERKRENALKDAARLFPDFVQALQSSHVANLTFSGFVFKSEHAALLLQTPIVTDALSVYSGSCAELTPAQLHDVLLHFSPISLDIQSYSPMSWHVHNCPLHASQLTDGLIRALSKNSLRNAEFPEMAPADGDIFRVTDDAIVDFFLLDEGRVAPMWKPYAELVVFNGRFTKALFKRLVEANTVSVRTRPLRIIVSPSPVEDEDLREFAQHLSLHRRGESWQIRMYDFPGEQQGAVAAMDLQIVLRSEGNKLVLIRARRPHNFFYKSDR